MTEGESHEESAIMHVCIYFFENESVIFLFSEINFIFSEVNQSSKDERSYTNQKKKRV